MTNWCERCNGAGFTGFFLWAKTCAHCKGKKTEPPPRGPSGPPCRECGKRMPRFDFSPCAACVSRHMHEVDELVRIYKAKLAAPMYGEGI